MYWSKIGPCDGKQTIIMGEEMHADDQSFAGLLKARGQHLGNQGKCPRTSASGGQNNPGRGSMHRSLPSWASTSNGGNDDLLNMFVRLSLRQEDALAQLSLNKNYMLFLQYEIQGHSDGRFKMGLPVLGPSNPDVEAQQGSSIDFGRNKNLVGTDCISWSIPSDDPQILIPQTDQLREPTPGRRGGDPMATGSEPQIGRNIGALPASAETLRMWHHTIHPLASTIGQPSTIPIGKYNLPTIKEMIRSLTASRFANSGSTCYINSILMAQVWSCFMSQAFNIIIWSPWER